jgi:hypothetical protein
MGHPGIRPTAVALIRHAPGGGEAGRRRARAAVATHADTEGYAVCELFEVFGRAQVEESVVTLLVQIAARADARAVLVLGAIGDDVLAEIEKGCSLPVLRVPAVTTGQRDPAWTGQLTFDVRNGNGRSVVIDVLVDVDRVTLSCGDRNLSVIERGVLRAWVGNPRGVLERDAVAWALRDRGLCLAIDRSRVYAIPDPTLRLFMAVI